MYKKSKASVLRPQGTNDGFDLAFPLKIPKWKLAGIVVSNFRVVVNYYFWLAQANITTANANLFLLWEIESGHTKGLKHGIF